MTELVPQSPPSPRTGRTGPEGSLATGVGQFFLALIGGHLLVAPLMSVLGDGGIGATFVLLLPWLLVVGVGLRHAVAGRRKTALGVLLGFGILCGGVLLLVAACFGLIASQGGLGNMH